MAYFLVRRNTAKHTAIIHVECPVLMLVITSAWFIFILYCVMPKIYPKILDEQGVLFTNEDSIMISKLSFETNLALASVYAIFSLLALLSILSPRRIVIFDREKKTIPIPPRWRIHKAETIPFYDAVVTFGAKVRKRCIKGDEEIVIANFRHIVKECSLLFVGRTNGDCFACLIQAYMAENDLSNHPEFETFRQIQEEIRINKLR